MGNLSSRDRPDLVPREAALLAASRDIEQADDLRRCAREIVQNGKEWQRWERQPFTERYLKGKLNIGLRCVDFGRPYYGAILEAAPNGTDADPKASRHVAGVTADLRGQHGNADEISVLPDIIEAVEAEQRRVPSIPRLQIFDDLSVNSGKPIYVFMSRVLPVEESRPATADGELRIFWVRETISCGEDIGKQIKTTSKTIDDETRLDIYDLRKATHIRELVNLLSVIRVHLLHNSVWATFCPSVDSRFQNWELGVGPINPGPYI